jgi:carbon monoxide dehydrogenase subunit G
VPVPELVESVDIDAPPERVWAALTDWSRQGEWMLATDVRPVTGPAQGVGGRLAAVTGLRLPRTRRIGVLDTMEITRWEPPTRVDVLHTGRVLRGPGSFEVRPRGAGTTFVWTEQLDLPLGAVGRLGWPLARPAVRAGVRISLRRFAAFAQRHPGRPGAVRTP